MLHALTPALDDARKRVADGGDPSREESWGIQGPECEGREDWRAEFSVDAFIFLWERELEQLTDGAVLVATADPFHHGIGYGDAPEEALPADDRGLVLARHSIEQGLAILARGDHAAYNRHCVEAKSDARDVGQVVRHLTGQVAGVVHELVTADMTEAYGAEPPTWVAGALIGLVPSEHASTERSFAE